MAPPCTPSHHLPLNPLPPPQALRQQPPALHNQRAKGHARQAAHVAVQVAHKGMVLEGYHRPLWEGGRGWFWRTPVYVWGMVGGDIIGSGLLLGGRWFVGCLVLVVWGGGVDAGFGVGKGAECEG